MRVKEIHVGLGATIDLGNFEFLKPVAEIVMELDEDDDVAEAYKAAWETVNGQVREQWKRIKG